MEIIEFKLNVLEDPKRWEDLPVISTLNIDSDSPIYFEMISLTIKHLARRTGQHCEVRWNRKSSFQGHYQTYGTVTSQQP